MLLGFGNMKGYLLDEGSRAKDPPPNHESCGPMISREKWKLINHGSEEEACFKLHQTLRCEVYLSLSQKHRFKYMCVCVRKVSKLTYLNIK